MLQEHAAARRVWDQKPVLRTVYGHFFDQIIGELAPGSVLEIGGGSGRLKERLPSVYVTDLHPSPYVDRIVDAQTLPFSDSSYDNIVMLDVLHHIPLPKLFLAEAQRVLRQGGRLIMLEPAITPGSYLFYKIFHPEPVDMSVDPLADIPLSTAEAYDSNQAIPTLLVTKYRNQLAAEFPKLNLHKVRWGSYIVYPLSGGLRRWSAVPDVVARPLLKLEDKLPNFVGRALGFRVLTVLERRI